jgi:DNA-binding LacI/PurR family transcriptional regulator
MAKFLDVVTLLEDRIRRGDYAISKFPGERGLASEVGVSRMTARKALKHLAQRGLLPAPARGTRRAVGRVPKVRQLAFLMPPVVSHEVQHRQRGVELAAASFGVVVRSVVYAHWSDVLIDEVLGGFDGVFLMQMGLPMPQDVLAKLRAAPVPVVSLDHDLSGEGIVSVEFFPRRGVHDLLDQVAAMGHRRIACLNSYPLPNHNIEQRIADWQEWTIERGLGGELVNQPHAADHVTGATAAEGAYHATHRLLAHGGFKDTALLCTALWTALGATRAMQELGVRVGRDLSVCVVNDEALGPWLNPRLTALQAADAVVLLAPCVDWMLRGGVGWLGPLLVTPRRATLFIGESTGAPAGRPSVASE